MAAAISDQEKQQIFQTEQAKHAVRSTAEQARNGWLYRILPAGIILIMIIVYSVQQVTGIPVYSIIGGNGAEQENYSGSSLLMARAILGVIIIMIILYLWHSWQESGSPAAFLVGEELAQNPLNQTEDIIKGQLQSQAQQANSLMATQQQSAAALNQKFMADATAAINRAGQVAQGVPVAPVASQAAGQAGQATGQVYPVALPGVAAGGQPGAPR